MASNHNNMNYDGSLAPKQELPPLQGFSRLAYERHIPFKGPKGWAILLGVTLMTFGGLWRARNGSRIRWELEREKKQARVHLYAFLQTEKDRFYLRAKAEHNALEQLVMKDITDYKLGQSAFHHHGKNNWYPELLLLYDDKKKHPVYPGLYRVSDLP